MTDPSQAPSHASAETVIGEQSMPAGAGATSAPLAPEVVLRVGMVLNNRYRLEEELGRGGVGQVFKARDRNLERAGDPNPFIALKALNAVSASDVRARDDLQIEALRAKKLSHDNIIRVDDFDWDGDHVFITMEYLKGAALDSMLKKEFEGGLDMAKAWPIISSIGAALEYAHGKGVIHSDMKPSNVFITRRNVVKVLDFGISRPMVKSAQAEGDTTTYTPATPAAGLTPAYAALEQWSGEPPDPRDDVYSFAVLVYEVLAGQHPFARASTVNAFQAGLVPRRIESLSRAQWEILRCAMAFKREGRTKSVKALLQGLAPPSILRRYRTIIITAAAASVAGAVIVGSQAYSDYVERQMLRTRGHPGVAHKPITPEQKKQIDESLFLANDYLRDVKLSAGPDELAYVLSEGANNVNQILDSVLDIDPGNTVALDLKSHVADLYLQKARASMGERNLAPALMLVRNGLRVMPDNLDLFHLQRSICDKDAALCAAD